MADDTIINPIIYIDTVTVSGVTYPGYPVGSITTSAVIRYGKNQPFPTAIVKIQKNLYNSLTYWENVTDGAGRAVTSVPSITDGVTPIVIQAYGTSESMRIEKHETDGSYLVLTCYTAAYKLKTTKIEALAAFEYNGSSFSFAYASQVAIQAVNVRTRASSEDYRFVLTLSVGTYTLYAQVSVDSSNDVTTEYIFGSPASLFAFIAVSGAGYDPSALLIDSGYAFTDAGSAIVHSDSYTSAQLTTFKASAHASLPSIISTVKLRGDAYCWEQIVALGYLTNCTPFFYDRAYFVDYNSTNSTEYYQSDKSVTVDYGNTVGDEAVGGCAERTYSASGTVQDTVYHDLTYIAANADQGSTYVRSAQEVDSENYKLTYQVSDASAKAEGDAVYFAYPCLDSQTFPGIGSVSVNVFATLSLLDSATGMFRGDIAYVSGTGQYEFYTGSAWISLDDLSSPRNYACAVIGLNLLVRYFEPGDCVALQMCEVVGNVPAVTFPSSSYIFNSFDALILYMASSPVSGDIAEVYEDGFTSYYEYNGTQWVFSDYGSDRSATFLPYTRVESFTDNQNHISLTNAPLACTELAWPACETTLWFGMPEFMDASQQLSSLDRITQSSSLTTTTDSDMSDKFAAKLVIGSQALSELDSTRSGFTGLIMEKNWNNDLYRLAGYNEGTVQAQFTSTGMISAGAGNVLLNASGITVTNGAISIDGGSVSIGGVTLDSNGLTGTGFSLNSSGLTLTSGDISIGGVTLNSSGLSGYGFSLGSSGLTLTRGTISIGNTVINSNGFTATAGTIGGNNFNSNGIQITNGSIVLGNTTIDGKGITIDCGTQSPGLLTDNSVRFYSGNSLLGEVHGSGSESEPFITILTPPTLDSYTGITLEKHRIRMLGVLAQFDTDVNLTGYNVAGSFGSLNSNGMMLVQGKLESVSPNSDYTVSMPHPFANTLYVVTVTPYGNVGSTGIGTDLHIESRSSQSFQVRIPNNCTQIMWIAIGQAGA